MSVTPQDLVSSLFYLFLLFLLLASISGVFVLLTGNDFGRSMVTGGLSAFIVTVIFFFGIKRREIKTLKELFKI
jgi:F0F1-type ATP synthase assembly protein I